MKGLELTNAFRYFVFNPSRNFFAVQHSAARLCIRYTKGVHHLV
jgi:hypothetical protein